MLLHLRTRNWVINLPVITPNSSASFAPSRVALPAVVCVGPWVETKEGGGYTALFRQHKTAMYSSLSSGAVLENGPDFRYIQGIVGKYSKLDTEK